MFKTDVSATAHPVWARLAVVLAVSVAACSEEAPFGEARKPGPSTGPLYAVFTQLASAEEPLSYFKTIEAVEPRELDLANAREFTGLADAWVWEGAVFIAEQETMKITKYAVDGDQLVEEAELGFTRYGLADVSFWVNVFLSPTKAYVVNGASEYIAWNPKTMEITGTVEMPELEDRDGLQPFASYTDRSVVVRDGLLYHPFYYTNDDYFRYAPTSSIAVYDIATDELVRVIEAPCPGIDHATQDEDGNLYFSAWTYAPGGAALLDQPSTCVAKIAQGSNEATVAFQVKDVTGGREGGVLRYTGGGKASLAVLHPDHAPAGDRGDLEAVTFGNNWQYWTYDFEAGSAEQNESIGWNGGSAYGTVIDGESYILLQTDEGGTTIFDISDPDDAQAVLQVDGWAMRLLKLR